MHSGIVDVLLPIGVNRPFTYAYSETLNRGDIVQVPFRRGLSIGIVWQPCSESPFQGNLKSITDKKGQLPEISLRFIEWVSQYTLTPLGLVAKMVLSGFQDRIAKEENEPYTFHTISLSSEQQMAVEAISKVIHNPTFHPFLLEGVTGSGKTEVYFHALAETLALKKQALVLLPEIALTTQIVTRFEHRFGRRPLMWHSGMTPRQRRETWHQINSPTPHVVVGARSALFLPFQDLGLIVVDEEHDVSYKQEEQVLYHARDMAIVRAQLSKSPIILASATPSLESAINGMQKRYHHLRIKTRHGGASFPHVQIVDMRGQKNQSWISQPLQEALAQNLATQQQSMLFLNRRGYAPLTLCHQCGHRLMCPGCTAWLVEHKYHNRLQCHHCGYHQSIPKLCPHCKSIESFIACGPGVERIQETVQDLFPTARLALLTSDSLTTPQRIHETLAQITNQDVDIVIGTQVLAKGHHFPFMTVIGIIDADLGLRGGDLRASERTFQLLHQVAGRAGREKLPGQVLLQTFQPENPVIQALVAPEIGPFLELEGTEREAAQMPPFARLASLIISSLNKTDAELTAKRLAQKAPAHPQITLYGPVPAPLAQLRGRYRWRLLLKAPREIKIQPYISSWLSTLKPKGTTRIVVDIDPYGFL